MINKNARYRVAVRFACEAAVSGGVNIKAISETFSCGNCSWISNLLQICYTICYNPLTMSSVLVVFKMSYWYSNREISSIASRLVVVQAFLLQFVNWSTRLSVRSHVRSSTYWKTSILEKYFKYDFYVSSSYSN